MPEKRLSMDSFIEEGMLKNGTLLQRQRIRMVSASLWHNHKPWSLQRRQCSDSFLLFIVKGAVRVTLDDGTRRIMGRGEYLMLPENRWHRLEMAGESKDLHQYSLHCLIEDRFCNPPFLTRFSHPFGRLNPAGYFFKRLRELVAIMSAEPELGQFVGESLVRDLLLERLRGAKDFCSYEIAGDPRVNRFIVMLEERFGDALLSVEALTREAGLSPVRMRQLFLQQTGHSPKTHLRMLRLHHASTRLRHSNNTIKEISRECGFSSDQYFHRVFHQHFECTPECWRKGSATDRQL